MFEYKKVEFYTEYFRKNKNFKLIDEFAESTDKDEKNLYVGTVEVLNTIHPLIIRVEIPFEFPHKKLTFRTKSLSGYPHLIHNGKIQYGDWFCLNTPFSETAEDQLNQETSRLREWIKRTMDEGLKAEIKDPNVIDSLRIIHAHKWEVEGEMHEFSSKATLTFVGDFESSFDYFKDNKGKIINFGHFHCVQTPDSRLYALRDKTVTNYELPYIIVDQSPSSLDVLSDFEKLREQYEWDNKICEDLLPDFNISCKWRIDQSVWFTAEDNVNEKDALDKLKKVEEELLKEDSYLPAAIIPMRGSIEQLKGKNKKLTKVVPLAKKILLDKVAELKNEVIKDHGYNPANKYANSFGDTTNEEMDEQSYYDDVAEYEYKIYHTLWHFFALGIKGVDTISWFLIYTCRGAEKYEQIRFDIGLKDIDLLKRISFPLLRVSTQSVSDELFFGRGAFSQNLRKKRIALVGLGAIGSMVANALAHSGVSKIGLWDEDIVEPGNICRSAYTLRNLGESKVEAIAETIKSINPFINLNNNNIQTVNSSITSNDLCPHGFWLEGENVNDKKYILGSFYGEVNYFSQKDAINQIQDYDIIFDCTASNELLHFISFALPDKDIISLCITNHSNDLLCISSKNGNPYEQRKAYLSSIKQDNEHFYLEGTGCYSPTFLANNCDIAALVNLALRDFNKNMDKGTLMNSTIYSYKDRGIVANQILTYKLDEYDITLNIAQETILDVDDIEDSIESPIGYIFGSYSRNGKEIMVTNIVPAHMAYQKLKDIFNYSNGVIDYIGDFDYSGVEKDSYRKASLDLIGTKACDPNINTNNPLLIIRNTDGTISCFLYINNSLAKFKKM